MTKNNLISYVTCSFVAMLLLFGSSVMSGQKSVNPPSDANIFGHVIDAETKEHLVEMTIRVDGTYLGTTTDGTGHYFIANLKPGDYTLVMSGVGYRTQEKKVTVSANHMVEVNFEAEEDVVNMDAVVVTADRGETIRRLAPTLVGVIDQKSFEVTNANNLLQGLSFQPGLRVENNCQNCNFTQVRINGLDGKYSQILIDSRPIFSALAGVYGLEQIPASMIERVEVVRGGGSALYGSNAIGGIVNIITKAPSGNSVMVSDNLSVVGMKTPDNSFSFNASVVSSDMRVGAVFFGQARNRGAWDADQDGFSELGRINGRSFGVRSYIKTTQRTKLTGEFHTIQEDRRGGDHLDLPDHVSQVTEGAEHSIYSGDLKFDGFSADYKHRYSLFSSLQSVVRKSFYGGTGDWTGLGIDPDREIGIGNPMDPQYFGQNNGISRGLTVNSGIQYSYDITDFPLMPLQLLVGVEYTYDYLSDVTPLRQWEGVVDENGKLVKDEKGIYVSQFPETVQALHNWSQILQLEWRNEMFSVLFGGRLDEHSMVKKLIFTPRATLRYNPTSDINLRFSYAKGFRAPQIFDEDLHVAVVNGEKQKIFNTPDLAPEFSHSFTLSGDFYARWGEVNANFLVEGFFNRILNIFTEEETGKVVQGFRYFDRVNSDGAKVYGVNLEGKLSWDILRLQGGISAVSHKFDKPVEWGLFVETEDGRTLEEGGMPKIEDDMVVNASQETREMFRAPNMYGYFTANVEPVKNLNIALSGNIYGKMKVPHSITYGGGAALTDIAAGNDPHKFDAYFDGRGIPEENREIRIDRLETTPVMMELGAKISYGFQIYNSLLEVSLGVNNLFNAFQKDFDKGPDRDSAYMYGPLAPRSLTCGLKLSF